MADKALQACARKEFRLSDNRRNVNQALPVPLFAPLERAAAGVRRRSIHHKRDLHRELAS